IQVSISSRQFARGRRDDRRRQRLGRLIVNPFRAFQTGVTRAGGKAQRPLNIDERIPLETAIDAYTINAAYAMKQDKTTGSLEAGKRADLVVLDRDILSVDPETIEDTKVLATYLNGRLVYS